MRASHMTCLPACSAAQVISQCMYGHVPITTASMSSAAISSRQSSYTCGIVMASATRCEDSRLRLQTLTTSTPSMARSPGNVPHAGVVARPDNPNTNRHKDAAPG